MKKEIIISIVIILNLFLISNVIAVGFSPSSLTFNLEQNEEGCQIISVSSESETIAVSDKWAENKDVEWKVSLFDTDASSHGIDINYDDELGLDDREIDVCLYGSEVGEYHGVLLLTEEQQGNSIIQMGIWLKVIIEPQEQQSNPLSSGGGGESSSGGGVSATNLATEQTNEENENEEEPELKQTSDEEQEENSGITGAVIGGKGSLFGFVVLIVIIAIISFIIYRRRRWKKFGY